MVRWIDHISDSILHCSILCLMWLNGFCLFLSLSLLVFFFPNVFFFLHPVKDTVTTESSGLYSVSSDLSMKVTKDDMNTYFYCEVTYFVPGAVKMMETKRINITVLCRCHGLDLPGFYEVLHL